MVFPSGKSVHARHRHGARGRIDPRKAPRGGGWIGWGLVAGLIALILLALPAPAETLRIATWNVGLERDGPGLLLRDILGEKDAQVPAVVAGIAALDADVLLLTGIDFDLGLAALDALRDRLAAAGAAYPHRFALPPNSGVTTGLDVDGDGRRGGPRDAQGYGRFAGAGGMAILSRLPIATDRARDFSAFLWQDLPAALLPPGMDPALRRVQRLSSAGHWDVPITLPDGRNLHLLAWHATPPVFDGEEDRNGRRNHDEAAFWLHLLAGDLPFAPPDRPFVLLGDGNLDPVDGDGRPAALQALLTHPRLQDPRPASTYEQRELDQSGDPALDTVLYPPPLGALRLDYVLPSRDLPVLASGVLRPAPTDPLAATMAVASRHYPVWADLSVSPDPPAASPP